MPRSISVSYSPKNCYRWWVRNERYGFSRTPSDNCDCLPIPQARPRPYFHQKLQFPLQVRESRKWTRWTHFAHTRSTRRVLNRAESPHDFQLSRLATSCPCFEKRTHRYLAWPPLQSLAAEKSFYFFAGLGGEKLLKFVEECRWNIFKRPERGLKTFWSRFGWLFGSFFAFFKPFFVSI